MPVRRGGRVVIADDSSGTVPRFASSIELTEREATVPAATAHAHVALRPKASSRLSSATRPRQARQLCSGCGSRRSEPSMTWPVAGPLLAPYAIKRDGDHSSGR